MGRPREREDTLTLTMHCGPSRLLLPEPQESDSIVALGTERKGVGTGGLKCTWLIQNLLCHRDVIAHQTWDKDVFVLDSNTFL